MLLGGRAAEELVFGEISTGAQDDLVKATRDRARAWCAELRHERARSGRSASSARAPRRSRCCRRRRSTATTSERTIDAEVRRIVDEQNDRVLQLLAACRELVRDVAAALLQRETLSGDDLAALVARSSCWPPAARAAPSLAS